MDTRRNYWVGLILLLVVSNAIALYDDFAPDDPAWDIDYRALALPDSSEWTETIYFGNRQVVVDGDESFLRMASGDAAYMYYTYNNWTGSLSVGVTVEVRVRVRPDVDYTANGVPVVVAGDSTGYAYLTIYGNGQDPTKPRYVTLHGSQLAMAYLDTTEFHTYRMVITNTTATLVIDGVTAAVVPISSSAANTLYFGDGTGSAGGHVDLDYLRVYTGGAVMPEEADEDPVAPDDPDWTLEYLGRGWPSDTQGLPNEPNLWERATYYGNTALLYEDGDRFARLTAGPAAYEYYSKWPSVYTLKAPYNDWDADFSVGATVEVRARVAETNPTGYTSGLSFVVGSPQGYAFFNVNGDPSGLNPDYPSGVELKGGNGTVSIPLDTLQWHTYRMTIKDTTARLYLDGQYGYAVAEVEIYQVSNVEYLAWGNMSTSGAGLGDIDYLRATNQGAFPDGQTVSLQSVIPAVDGSLPRKGGNEIRIVADGAILGYPEPALNITRTGVGTDVGGDFIYSLETTYQQDDTLVAVENGVVLEQDAWYQITPAMPWIEGLNVSLVGLRGDVDNDLEVTLSDLIEMTGDWLSAGELGRMDLDGDGQVDLRDVSILSEYYQTVASANPWVAVTMTDHPANPVLVAGGEPTLATEGVLHCAVRRKDASSNYMMWYSGDRSNGRRIYLATSPDGATWTKQGVVLDGSTSGGLAHMPSVLWDATAGLWKMWYTGNASGSQSIIYATSVNGSTWTHHGMVFGPSAGSEDWDASSVRSPAVLFDPDDNLYKMWYWGNNNGGDPEVYGDYGTGFATSPDGINWTRQGKISDESRLSNGDVLKINGVFYMFSNFGPHIGMSISLDGMTWQDYTPTPLIYAATQPWKPSYINAASMVYDSDAGQMKVYYYGADYSQAYEGTSIGFATTPFGQ